MARREFPKPVYVAIVKRATDAQGVIRCEECHGACARYQVDHIKADGLEVDKSAKLTAKEGRLLCIPCHKEKTAIDVAVIAKAKRREAKHLGARAAAKIKSRGFARVERERQPMTKKMPPRAMFVARSPRPEDESPC